MSQQIESEIIRILTQARDEIRANLEAKNINASGRTSKSIRVEVMEGGFRLVGGYNTTHKIDDYPYDGGADAPDTAPIPTLEVGRKGGGSPPVPRGFYYIIRQWSKDKGLSFTSESDRNAFAAIVARRIAKDGTGRHKNPVDVYSTPVTTAKERLHQLFNDSISHTIRAALGTSNVKGLAGAFTK